MFFTREEMKIMIERERRKRGAQPGNQNARKHGLYISVLDRPERQTCNRIAGTEGLDQEVLLLMAKLGTFLEKDSQDPRLLLRALHSLAALMKASHSYALRNQQNELLKSIEKKLTQLAASGPVSAAP
jgi:hypothetical protein